MQKKKLEILITNDDGYHSKGFKTAVEIFSKYGNVTAIAPKDSQSGKSASLTMDVPLWLKKIHEKTASNGNSIRIYSFTGAPVDCIKMAMNKFFDVKHLPDLLISGINHGSNASVAAVYSGTLGAAKEGTIYGIPSIGLSINTHKVNANFAPVKKYIGVIIKNFFACPPVPGTYLNINFPDIPVGKIKGIKFAESGNGMWLDELNSYKTPQGKEYFWTSGEFHDKDISKAGDHSIVEAGYIAITPHKVNNTDYEEIERLLNKWKF